MKTIEIWPKEIEGGDAVSGDITATYLRLTDPEEGVEVIAFFTADTLQQLVRMVGANVFGKGDPN